jgi:EmrB/QacA subfamily drug resistance transporter
MVNLALPAMGRDLAISIEDSRWVVQSFLLTIGALLLLAGRLGDLWGHRRVYLAGFALFGAASLACGLAGSFAVLVVFRVLQGIGGALVLSTAPALLTLSFPGKQRGRALGLQATATYIGLTIGPTLGGLIISALGWRWTFYVYVPAAILVMALGYSYLPRKKVEKRPKFDLPGAFTLLIGLPFLLLLVSESQRWGAGFWMTWVVLGLGIAGILAFVLIQLRSTSPLLDFSLFRSRVFSGSALSAVANYIALFCVFILMPFYLEEGLHLPTAVAGLTLSACPLVMAVVASPSGWLSDRIGSRGLATGGMLVLAAGIFGLSRLGADESIALVVLCLAVVGLGTGIFISPNSSALMGAAPRHQQGAAGAIMAESRTLGMFIGVAVSTAIFHAAGGQTGTRWTPTEFEANQLSLLAGTGVAILGALFASLRGKKV